MESCPFGQETRHSTGGLRDAFADVMIQRYRGDLNVQGRIVRDFGLTVDVAKGLMQGKTSIATMEHVLQHKNGGWRIGLAVLSIVIGRRIVDFIASEKDRLDHEAEQRRRRADELREAEGFLVSLDVGAVRSAGDHLGSR